MIDEILASYDLKYEELSKAERETLDNWEVALHENQLTVERVREYVSSMIDAVSFEIAQVELKQENDTLLKARLRNYLLLKAFLSTPEKARKQIEETIKALSQKKVS